MADGGHATTAPLHPTAEGPADGRAFWIKADDSVRLRTAVWTRDAPKGTVIIFPGRTECVEKYGRTAHDLAARGFATLTIDWRGQGLADRLIPNAALGHVHAFSDYQRDVAAMLAQARSLGLPEPYFLLAHSMGGCIGLRALHNRLPVAAAAFSAPMWGIGIAPAMRPVAWTLSTLSRPLGFDRTIAPGQTEANYLARTPFEGNTLTTDRGQWDYMLAQTLAVPGLSLGGPTLRWLNESLREMRALHALPSPPVPTVTFLGTAEAIVDPLRVQDRMARWPGGDLVMLKDAQHEVLMEAPVIRHRVLERLSQHFGG